MENIEEIKPNTPIILYNNINNEEKLITIDTKNISKDKQCFLELFVSDENNNRQSIFRRLLNCEEQFSTTPYSIRKNEKYLAIVSHCQVKIKVRYN